MVPPPPDAVLPRDARLVALLISSCPSITDAQPAVLLQLLEFAQRYTAQVLSDALVYAEHAGRSSSVDEEDVKLAVQSRVGWEFGGRVPKDFLLSLGAKTNAKPLPPVPEVFGVRLPPAKHCLTAVDFDLIPNKPPPGLVRQEEEEEEEENSGSEGSDDGIHGLPLPGDDDDLEMADGAANMDLFAMPGEGELPREDLGQPVEPAADAPGNDEGEPQEDDDLFGEEDDDEDVTGGDDAAGRADYHPMPNGIGVGEKRKASDEDDDYDA